MPALMLTWHASMDAKTCKVCRALHGYVWTFHTKKDELPPQLSHPEFGVVWNLHQGSEAHGHTGINCRCFIQPSFDFSDLRLKVEGMLNALRVRVEALP